MSWLEQFQAAHPVAHALLILSAVAAAGLAFGALKIRGIGLGIAGVLFSGIVFGHFGWGIEHGTLEFVRDFGLVLFVYTIGMQVGPGFFTSLRRHGLPLNLLAAGIVLLGAALTVAVAWVGKIDIAAAVGLFSGGTTNTPALGAAQEALRSLPGIDPARLTVKFQQVVHAAARWVSSTTRCHPCLRRLSKVRHYPIDQLLELRRAQPQNVVTGWSPHWAGQFLRVNHIVESHHHAPSRLAHLELRRAVVGIDPYPRRPRLQLRRARQLRHESQVEHAAGASGYGLFPHIRHAEKRRQKRELLCRDRQAERPEPKLPIKRRQIADAGNRGSRAGTGRQPDFLAVAYERHRLARTAQEQLVRAFHRQL